MVIPSRTPHDRYSSTQARLGRPESPPLSASSISSLSIVGDNDPLNNGMKDGAGEEVGMDDMEGSAVEGGEHERRGRSSATNTTRFDPRDMSPRRNSEELALLGAETKAKLEAQAQSLQSGLLALLDRVEKFREEHDKLEGENRFLQEYIGSLMATSKITGSTGSRNRIK